MFIAVLASLLSACIGSENSEPDMLITFENNTDAPLIYLRTFGNQTVEESVAPGFPPNRPVPAGDEFSVALNPLDRSASQFCEIGGYHFFHLIDPESKLDPWDEDLLAFDDLTLVQAIVDPCWNSGNPRVSIEQQ